MSNNTEDHDSESDQPHTEETTTLLLMQLLSQLQGDDLISKSVDDAIESFLNEIKEEQRYDTFLNHESVLKRFIQWIETTDENIDVMKDLHGNHFHQFKNYLRDRDNQKISLNGALSSFRVFIKFCEQNDFVEEDLQDDIPVPDTNDSDEIRTDPPLDALVEQAKEYYSTHEYASRRHVEFELLREYGIRSGAARSIDEEHYHYEEAYIELHHNPEGNDEKGTPLKNGTDSERELNLPEDLNELIHDYVQNDPVRAKHGEVVDRYGRHPLFTTEDNKGETGRPRVTTIRRDLYKMTRPCMMGHECPEGRDPESCEAERNTQASKCPANTSPHPLRTWSIMNQLDHLPMSLVSDRCDVSVPTLEKHYDHRSETRKRRKRKAKLVEHMPGYSVPSDTSKPDIDDSEVESEPAKNQSRPSNQPQSPLSHFIEYVRHYVDLPEPAQWLWDDFEEIVFSSEAAIPRSVQSVVILYCSLTVFAHVLPLMY